MEVRANIFFIRVHLLQIEIKLHEPFFNPSHEFFLHNIARDPKIGELLIVGFGESIAIEAVIVCFRIKNTEERKEFLHMNEVKPLLDVEDVPDRDWFGYKN
jgi:hypothetical protein